MSNSFYNKYKTILHGYSRSPYMEGQQFPDQAGARAGHYVNQYEVRAEKIPPIADIDTRDTLFLTERDGKRIVGGECGRSYTRIIKFLDKISLTEIVDTNGEAWVVQDEQGNVYRNFICPTDMQISETQPSRGYEVQLFANDGETPIPFNYGWSFDTFNGILHFSSKFNPNSPDWKFGTPKIEAFIYIGKYASDEITKVNEGLISANIEISQVEDSGISIQPYKFSTDEMIRIGDPYIKEYTGLRKTVPVYYQKLSFIVKGYCFEISEVDNQGHTETIITEMSHISPNNCKACSNRSNHRFSSTNITLSDEESPLSGDSNNNELECHCGDTEIFIDVPWDIDAEQPIVYYTFNEPTSSLNNVPKCGKYFFIASAFIRNDGNRVNVKKIIDYHSPSGEMDYELGYDREWTPSRNTNCHCNNSGNNIINLNF